MASHAIVLQLTRAVRRRLHRLSLKTRHKVMFRWCQMVLPLAHGNHPTAIARALGGDVSTVYRTRQAFQCAGEGSLTPRKALGVRGTSGGMSPTISISVPCRG